MNFSIDIHKLANAFQNAAYRIYHKPFAQFIQDWRCQPWVQAANIRLRSCLSALVSCRHWRRAIPNLSEIPQRHTSCRMRKESKRHKTIADRAPGNQLDSPRRCVPASVCQAISVYCTDGIQQTVLQRPAASVGSLERKRPVRAQQSGFCHCDKMPRQHNSVGFAAV